MIRVPHSCWRLLAWALVPLALASCRGTPPREAKSPPPPPDLRPTVIDYVDSDAFDALFESALVTQEPVVVIRTFHQKPDWEGRLNAWIAAWNGGSRARTIRGQVPLPGVVVDGDSLREFRLLVNGLMDRVEVLARNTSTWWAEERTRARRVALLRPYSLRFHMADDGNIVLIFFHGNYADAYPRFMGSMTEETTGELPNWSRGFDCSMCRRLRGEAAAGTLTSRSRSW